MTSVEAIAELRRQAGFYLRHGRLMPLPAESVEPKPKAPRPAQAKPAAKKPAAQDEPRHCPGCGRDIGTDRRRKRCPACASAHGKTLTVMTSRHEREKRRAAGLCHKCGRNAPVEGGTTCEECRARNRATRARQKARERLESSFELGRHCHDCGKALSDGYACSVCPECLATRCMGSVNGGTDG